MSMRPVVKRLYWGLLWFMPKKLAHKILYRRVIGKKLNLKKPKDFNEKLQYLMLCYYGRKEGDLADKELAKKYVLDKKIEGLEIPRTLRLYGDASEIEEKDLPEKFVLKCNNGSGEVLICKNKKTFDLKSAKKILSENLKRNYAKRALEYHYSYIKPKIMLEEYLDDGKHENPIDYKIYCFMGKAESILVCSNREHELKLNDFSLDWKELDYTFEKYRATERLEKPKELLKMIKIAEELSKGLFFARVDLYCVQGKIFFGELTFTPAAGLIYYYKQKALDELGEKMDLSQIENVSGHK